MFHGAALSPPPQLAKSAAFGRRPVADSLESHLPYDIARRRIAADEIIVVRVARRRAADRRRAVPDDLGVVRVVGPAAGGAEIRRRRCAVPAALVDPAAGHLVVAKGAARAHPHILAL